MSDDAKLLEAASFFLRATAARIERDNLLVNDGAPHFASGAAIALPVHGRRVRVEVRVTIRTAPKHETRTDVFGRSWLAVSRQDAIDSLTSRDDNLAYRLRNYEIEGKLCDVFEGSWIVWEACPFNGDYCAWGRATGRTP